MHLRVLPFQIPSAWETIKYAVAQMNEIPTDHRLSDYCTWLLHMLLSEKAQCWVTLNDDRMLLNVVLTFISTHKITGERQLQIIGIYAFQGLTDTMLSDAMKLYQRFARTMDCKVITGLSRHQRVCEIMERCGFVPEYHTYVMRIGD